jgi:hypothetical protein
VTNFISGHEQGGKTIEEIKLLFCPHVGLRVHGEKRADHFAIRRSERQPDTRSYGTVTYRRKMRPPRVLTGIGYDTRAPRYTHLLPKYVRKEHSDRLGHAVTARHQFSIPIQQ